MKAKILSKQSNTMPLPHGSYNRTWSNERQTLQEFVG